MVLNVAIDKVVKKWGDKDDLRHYVNLPSSKKILLVTYCSFDNVKSVLIEQLWCSRSGSSHFERVYFVSIFRLRFIRKNRYIIDDISDIYSPHKEIDTK